ncbi:hypothetical protein ACMA5I_04670 [Paracoccaceae bacterium GXU_MW_L88]
MQTRLELLSGPQAGAARVTDLSTPFTIGTRSGATWQVPGEGEDAFVTIRRGGMGLEMEASGDVQIEGHAAAEGRTTPIGHGSRLTVSGQLIQLTISQASASPSSLGQAPSISAILSDVTSSGSDGPLPGIAEDNPLNAPAAPRSAASRYWQEPKAFEEEAASPLLPASESKLLPDDWDSPDSAGSSDRLTQTQGPTTRARFSQETAAAPEAPKAKVPPVSTKPLLNALGLVPQEVQSAPEEQIKNAGLALAKALEGLRALEDNLMRHFRELGVSIPESDMSTQYALHPAAALSDNSGQAITALTARIAMLTQMQSAMAEGSRAALKDAKDSLDPEIISTAQAGEGGFLQRLTPETAFWRAYQARFAPKDGAAPLSEQALAAAIRARLGHGHSGETGE